MRLSPTRSWVHLVALLIAGCTRSSTEPAKGQIIVAVTIDWEGADVSLEGLDALDELRTRLGAAPLTHFVSAAYFTKDSPDPTAVASLKEAVRRGDELALHLHAWRSLAKPSGIEPRESPSFLTGTDELLAFEGGDLGFDTDLDAYGVPELRALLRASRRLLEQTHVRVSKTFRAGGYLGTPKVLQAVRDEGYTVDSSAIDHRQLDEQTDGVLPSRLAAIWPGVETTTQPFVVETRSGALLEMPIAAVADFATAAEIVDVVEAAHASLQKDPTRNVFVVLTFHLETAADFGGRLGEALDGVLGRRELADVLEFTTVERAAELARRTLVHAPD